MRGDEDVLEEPHREPEPFGCAPSDFPCQHLVWGVGCEVGVWGLICQPRETQRRSRLGVGGSQSQLGELRAILPGEHLFVDVS